MARKKTEDRNPNDDTGDEYKLYIPAEEVMLGQDGADLSQHDQLLGLDKEQYDELAEYLVARLQSGHESRNKRLRRYMETDRLISTWRKHDPLDTKRLNNEDKTGRQTAVQANLPLSAAHLEDLTAFYTDTIAPIGTPFVTAGMSPGVQDVIQRLTKDVLARNYYGHVAMTCRSLLKYNTGGIHVSWDTGATSTTALSGVKAPGNSTEALDMYNTLWDPTVVNPEDVATKAEWAALIRPVNRVQLLRGAVAGKWTNIERVIPSAALTAKAKSESVYAAQTRLWVNSAKAVPTEDGGDQRTDSANEGDVNWASLGLAIPADYATRSDLIGDTYELITIYAWIAPQAFGLLNEADLEELKSFNTYPNTFIELWKFEMVNSEHVISAKPAIPRKRTLERDTVVIPVYMCYMIQDNLANSQRAHMELVAPFQRFVSSLYSIGVEALRKNVWGTKAVDPSMFKASDLESGSTAQVLVSKKPGVDVRQGLLALDNSTGAEQAFGHVQSAMQLKNTLFPSQALPAQIAGLDRAVSNQVSSIVHGAQQALRMTLRLIDASLFMPVRIETVRNLQRYEELQAADISDEELAKELGSGIESMEAERVTEALWRLMMAIIQNQEAMQFFDVPQMLGFLGRTLRVNVDMSTFVRKPPEGQGQPGQNQPQQQVMPGQPPLG